FRTSFLEPTTHEILSTFIPSEGSSSKVEEVVKACDGYVNPLVLQQALSD
ncbi:hypothetical protein H8959_020256, partial [Pygathrix nigripes]